MLETPHFGAIAALAVGLTQTQAMRHVVLPQAVRRVVPPLLNDFVSLQKDTALVASVVPFGPFVFDAWFLRERSDATANSRG